MLLWVVIPSVMLHKEDYLGGEASGYAAVHLIAGQHQLFSNLQVIWLRFATSVDPMEVPQGQYACSIPGGWMVLSYTCTAS